MIEPLSWEWRNGAEENPFRKGSTIPIKITIHSASFKELNAEQASALDLLKELAVHGDIDLLDTDRSAARSIEIGDPKPGQDFFDVTVWSQGQRGLGTYVPYPGKLDNIVAGGQPFDLSYKDNLIKECMEEAGMPHEMATRAIPVGAISYTHEAREEGLKPNTLLCYDLEMPEDFVPQNNDGEIDQFTLCPIQDVAAIVRDTQRFKLNCNLVIIDFLVRHGLIEAEHPDYHAICQGLRR